MSVKVAGLTKRFTQAGTPAVAEVSFTAPAGAITALLGPSGSGKSTVLRIIAGLEQPDAGSVHFDGAEATHLPVQARNAGFVFQSYALFKHMTVRDNVAFGLAVRKAPRAEIDARVSELLAQVQLDGLGERFPGELSGGQRQRVAFARALAIKPRILLLDEPFGALDARVRTELRDWLRRFHDQHHVTTLLVTHDQEEAMELSEHVVVMQGGRVEQAGPPREIYDHPATPFVASFVGGAKPVAASGEDGKVVLVRPQDVSLQKAPESAGDDAQDVSLARIEKIAHVGGQARLTLRLADGSPMEVHMRRAEVESLALREGDRVMVDLKEAKVFVEDYSI